MNHAPRIPHSPRAGGVSPRRRGGPVGGGRRRLCRGTIPLPGRQDGALPGGGRGGGFRMPAGGSAASRRDQRHPLVGGTPRLPGVPPSPPGRRGRRGDPERSGGDRTRAPGDPLLADLRLRRALRPQSGGRPGLPGPGGRRRRPPLGGPARRDSPHQEGIGASDRGLRVLPPGVPPSRQVRVDRIRRRGGRGRDGLRETGGSCRFVCRTLPVPAAPRSLEDELPVWIAAGADVFKIEGRELSPPAVAALVIRFRRKMDAACAASAGG